MTQNSVGHEPWHYRPGEMVVAVELGEDEATHARAHGAVRQALEGTLGRGAGSVFRDQQRHPTPIVFRARGRPPLGFLFYDLAEPDSHDYTKQAIHDSHANDLAAFDSAGRGGITPIGVMPHWLGSLQQGFDDGSPATLPGPVDVEPGRWTRNYAPTDESLDFRRQLAQQSGGSQPEAAWPPVLVLDTEPDWSRVRQQADHYRDRNAQLPELLNFLGNTDLEDWHVQALAERNREALKLAPTPDGRSRDYDMSDHSMFIAGLIHDLSPRSPVWIRPVLNRFGVGDFHLLLQVLESVLRNKATDDPLVINMSFGYLPKWEQLPWLWYGVQPANDPDFVSDVPIRGEARDVGWMNRNRPEIERTRRLLHTGIERLAEYLLLNNCLGVAAVGNDSLHRVQTGRPRFGPRVPARYGTILGVAATTSDPDAAAEYSNLGDTLEVGDHIATFGGGINATEDLPRDGVIGVYTAPTFPRPDGSAAEQSNTNGWAAWSGTSFATAIASGLVGAFWSANRDLRADEVLAQFHTLARHYAPAVATPSIGMRGTWEAVAT
ncbi:MAG: S8/S53 family peptidase [Chloroflexi bacterium]|nr:S8/S53 family peptidase [Chloroflexota bacterium]